MKIGILGTGIVGNTIGSKLYHIGHEICIGSRTKDNTKAIEWVKDKGPHATHGTFADAAFHAAIIFNCTSGAGSMEALKAAGAENLSGKILIDVSNPLEFSPGKMPSLVPSLSNTTSLGEEIQKAFPDAKVVKALNTMRCTVMVNPAMVPGDHDVFICGNDADAKEKVKALLEADFGWTSFVDLGDITGARGMEMILPIWIRLNGVFKSPHFNFKIVK